MKPSHTRTSVPTLLVLGLLSLPCSLAVAPSQASAQLSAADSAAVLLEAATRFEQEGRWEIAEAIYVHITEWYGGTPAAQEAASRLAAEPEERIERLSRVELQVFGTLYGLWLGVAVPIAFGAEDAEAFGAGLLLGGPIGLFGSRAYLRANPLSEGQARAISWGGVWGRGRDSDGVRSWTSVRATSSATTSVATRAKTTGKSSSRR